MNDQSWLQRAPFKITPISPIHLGAGEDLDWTATIADGDQFLLIDLFQAHLPAQEIQKIDEISRQANDDGAILKLQQLIAKNRNIIKKSATGAIRLLPQTSRKFHDKLGRNVGPREYGKNVINTLKIERTAHEAFRQAPVIPGSSLKGAIRTCWLDHVVKPHHLSPDGKKLEEREALGGSFSTDPFRLIKIEDARTCRIGGTSIVTAHNVYRKSGAAVKGLNVNVEAIAPYQYGLFDGALVRSSLKGHYSEIKDRQVPEPPMIKDLMAAVNKYYLHLFDEQIHILSKMDVVDMQWLNNARKLLQELTPGFTAGDLILVRLGKYGSAEGKTVNEYRQISVGIGRQSKNLKNGTTFWLAGDVSVQNLIPFGWAIIEMSPPSGSQAILETWCEQMAESTSIKPGAEIELNILENPVGEIMSVQDISYPQTDGEKRLYELRVLLEALKKKGQKAGNNSAEARLVRNSLKQAAIMNWTLEEQQALVDIIRTLGKETLKLFDWNSIDQQLKKLGT